MATRWNTIPELLDDAATRFERLEALVDGEVRLRYGALREAVIDAGQSLVANGVGVGDRVAIWAPNCWEWVVVALATHMVGGVVVPINTRFKAAEAGSRALVVAGPAAVHGDGLPRHRLRVDAGRAARRRARRTARRSRGIVTLRGAATSGSISFADFLASGDDVDRRRSSRRAPPRSVPTTSATSCSRRARPVARRA